MSPEVILTRVVMPVSMAAIMFGLGTTLTPADFRRVLRRPRAAAVGLVGQLVAVPLIAVGAASLMDLEPLFAVGLVIIAACPGGVLSNLVSWFARGDAALSVSLTAVTSCLSLITLPSWLAWATARYLGEASAVSVSPLTVGEIALLTVIPVLSGLAFRRRWPARAEVMERPFKVGGLVFMVLTLVLLLASRRGSAAAEVASVAPAVLVLHFGTLAVGAAASLLARLPRTAAVTVTLEVGIQNAALGMTVAAGLLGEPALAIPSAVYGFVMFQTSVVLIAIGRRFGGQSRKSSSSSSKLRSQR